MITSKNEKLKIKDRVLNIIMKNGNKKTVEKNFLKVLKQIQKNSNKKHSNIFLLSIKNNSSSLKMNKQKQKRGKRKTTKDVPVFVKEYIRLNLSFKLMLSNSIKKIETANLCSKLYKEILESSMLKSKSFEQKTELQKQVLLKKKYFFKFRW